MLAVQHSCQGTVLWLILAGRTLVELLSQDTDMNDVKENTGNVICVGVTS